MAQALTPFFKPARRSRGPDRAPRSLRVGQAAPSPQPVGGGPHRRTGDPRHRLTLRTAPSKPNPEGVAWESLIEFKETERRTTADRTEGRTRLGSGASPSVGLGVGRDRSVALRARRRLGGDLQDQERDDRFREPPGAGRSSPPTATRSPSNGRTAKAKVTRRSRSRPANTRSRSR